MAPLRPFTAAGLALLALAGSPALAQGDGSGHGRGDGSGGAGVGGGGRAGGAPGDDRRAPPAAPSKRLAFEVPAGWSARPASERGFTYDYDLPAAAGDPEGARVNLLYYPVGVEAFRGRLSHRWRRADGTPHPLDACRPTTVLEQPGLTIRTVELAGTFSPKEAPPRAGYALVAAHLDVPGGAWTAWLFGPAASVAASREAYLGWLRSVRVADAPAAAPPAAPATPAPASAVTDPTDSQAVREVRFVHGAPPHGVPGPWALVGWRIGADALKRLGIDRGRAWELVVTHRAPDEVRYTCMIDGLQAATGASVGKRNLTFEPVADEAALETIVVHRPSGRRLTYHLTTAFRDVIRPVDFDDFPAAAARLDMMPEAEMWTVEEGKAP